MANATVHTFSVLSYPLDVFVDARVDTGFASTSAQYAPAGDSSQLPRLFVARLSDKRTTRVAGARVSATQLVTGARHVALHPSATVPAAPATQRVRKDWHHHLVQNVVACRSCTASKTRSHRQCDNYNLK